MVALEMDIFKLTMCVIKIFGGGGWGRGSCEGCLKWGGGGGGSLSDLSKTS